MKKIMIVVVLLIALAAGGYGYFTEWAPCAINKVARAEGEMTPVLRRWDNVNKISSSLPRVGLAANVGLMGAILEKVKGLQMPACMESYRTNIVTSMENTVNGYLAFIAEKPDDDVKQLFSTADQSFEMAMQAISAVHACMPFCK